MLFSFAETQKCMDMISGKSYNEHVLKEESDMEFVRSDLKDQSKALIAKNYWGMVGAGIAMAIATGALLRNTGSAAASNEEAVQGVQSLTVFVSILGAAISLAIVLFIFHPLEFGASKYFLKNISGEARGTLFDGFKQENLSHAISVYFYRNVMIFLFALLLVIPGIIKSYEYYFVNFLAVDHPELSGKELCAMSKRMTDGSKWNLFVLDISYILWEIAAALTGGLVGIFYLYPYRYQTRANAYRLFLERGMAGN